MVDLTSGYTLLLKVHFLRFVKCLIMKIHTRIDARERGNACLLSASPRDLSKCHLQEQGKNNKGCHRLPAAWSVTKVEFLQEYKTSCNVTFLSRSLFSYLQ